MIFLNCIDWSTCNMKSLFIFLLFCISFSNYSFENPKKSFKNGENLIEEYLYDSNFKESYLLKYFKNYATIYKKDSMEKVYETTSFIYPFGQDKYFHIFNENTQSDLLFLCSDGNYIWEPSNTETRIKIDECYNAVSDFQPNATYIDSVPDNATKIQNYNYFLNLKERHGDNINSICTLVAIQILSSYFDTFYNDNFVPEIWDYLSTENVYNPIDWTNWSTSPGAGYQNFPKDSRMINYLLDYTRGNVAHNIESVGLTYFQQRDVLNYYLNSNNISYSLNTSAGNLSDVVNNKAKTIIQL